MALNWQDRYEPQRDPDRTLRYMTRNDIPGAVALAEAIGWPHREADWARILDWSPDGCFVIEEDDSIIGTVSTTPYGKSLAWIGMMIIRPDRQRKGLGKRLARAALDHLILRETERIMLDSTGVGRGLYRSLGFREVAKIERWEGRASTYLGPRARALRRSDRDAALQLDKALFGLDRAHLLTRLMDEFPDLAWVDEQRGHYEGYLIGQRLGNGVRLGPWMSWNAVSAERLLLVALEQLQGEHIIIYIPDQNGRGQLLARNHNLRRVRHNVRMIYGEARPARGELLAELAIGSSATG